MRTTAATAAFAALLSPLAAQRTLDVDHAHHGPLGEQQSFAPFVTDIHSLEADPEGGAYGIWAAGADYKVSFHDGATFVPYLGGNYPHNQPFRWTTTSVTVGNQELLTRPDPLPRQASGTRYCYDHGGVIEAYDVLLDGLEQTFVIPTAPAAGDLVVRGAIETQLTAAPVADRHTAIQFVDHNGDPILTYGAATAVDAAGRRMPMTTTFADGVFELGLDAGWLADASYPVVVDPYIGPTSTLHSWSGAFGSPGEVDVLREDSRATENVWICYTRQVSATDQDLWVMRTGDTLQGPLFHQAFVDLTASWGIESCALAHTASRVICAFVRDLGTSRNVHWHAHHVNDLAKRTSVGSFTAFSNNWRVDIGGNRGNSASKRAMVVVSARKRDALCQRARQRSLGVLHRHVGGDDPGRTRQRRELVPGSYRRRSRRGAPAHQPGRRWVSNRQPLVRGVSVLPPQHRQRRLGHARRHLQRIRLARVRQANRGQQRRAQARADRGRIRWSLPRQLRGDWMPFASARSRGKAGRHLYTQRVDYGSGPGVTFPHPPYNYLNSARTNLETSGIAYDTNTQSHWLVTFFQGNRVTADEYGYRGVRKRQFSPVQKGGSTLNKLNAACSFDKDNDRYVIVGSAAQATGNPVFGNIWYHLPIAPPSLAGVGCSSATLSWSQLGFRQHNQRVGHEYSGALLLGVPTGAPAVLGISGSSANLSLSGIGGFGPGCNLLIGNAVFLGGQVGSLLGSAAWGLPLNETLVESTLQLQAFHLDASGSMVLSTQRLSSADQPLSCPVPARGRLPARGRRSGSSHQALCKCGALHFDASRSTLLSPMPPASDVRPTSARKARAFLGASARTQLRPRRAGPPRVEGRGLAWPNRNSVRVDLGPQPHSGRPPARADHVEAPGGKAPGARLCLVSILGQGRAPTVLAVPTQSRPPRKTAAGPAG